MSQDTLPEYRVKARNTSSSSENVIHHDDEARRYGFAAALVPGITIYAYLTHPVVEAFGPAWLARAPRASSSSSPSTRAMSWRCRGW